MKKRVYLSQLKEVSILWAGDIYMLAEFILRSHAATDRQRNAQNENTRVTSFPTLHGIALKFAILTGTPALRVEKEFTARGFNLGATVEFDPTPIAQASPLQSGQSEFSP
jgi:hypothetical protein